MTLVEKLEVIDGPYPEPPSKIEIDEFLQFANESGEPESFPLLALTPPPRGQEFKILAAFEIPMGRRPGGVFIPCVCCGTKNKFLAGRLIWSGDGHIRILGKDCAKRHFGDERTKHAEAQYRFEKIRDAKHRYLMSAWPRVNLLLNEAEKLAEKATQLEAIITSIRKNAPELFGVLTYSAQNNSGALTVSRRHDDSIVNIGLTSSTGSASQFYDAVVSTVRGFELFKPNRRWSLKLRDAIREISPLSCSADEVAAKIDSIASEDSVGLARSIERATTCLVAIHEELSAANRFICDDNVTAIRRWILAAKNSERIFATLQGPVMQISEYGRATSSINIPKNPPVPKPETAIALFEDWR